MISQVYRTLHTLKGSAEASGFLKIYEFIHELENLFSQIRNGTLEIRGDLLELMLKARDHIGRMIDFQEKTDIAIDIRTVELVRSVNRYNKDESG